MVCSANPSMEQALRPRPIAICVFPLPGLPSVNDIVSEL